MDSRPLPKAVGFGPFCAQPQRSKLRASRGVTWRSVKILLSLSSRRGAGNSKGDPQIRLGGEVARESHIQGTAVREEGWWFCGGFGSGLLLLKIVILETLRPPRNPPLPPSHRLPPCREASSSRAPSDPVVRISADDYLRLPARRRALCLVAQIPGGRISLCESA